MKNSSRTSQYLATRDGLDCNIDPATSDQSPGFSGSADRRTGCAIREPQNRHITTVDQDRKRSGEVVPPEPMCALAVVYPQAGEADHRYVKQSHKNFSK